MSEEVDIQQELGEKLPYMRDKIVIKRPRRIFAEVTVVNFPEVFDYVVRQMGFTILCTITGLDQGVDLGIIYHVARPGGIVLNLATSVHKIAPICQTVTPYFASAEVYEREMIDLLGLELHGLPPGSRYPLPDGWPEGVFPLRKDWNLKMLLWKDARKEKEAANAARTP
jgi:membrane-bound hydrogenase subunit beta